MELSAAIARLFAPTSVFPNEHVLDDALAGAESANAASGLPSPRLHRPASADELKLFELNLHTPLPRSYRRALELSDGIAWLWKRVWLLSVDDLSMGSEAYDRAVELKRKFRQVPLLASGLIVGLAFDPACDAMLILDLRRSSRCECPLLTFDGARFVEHDTFGAWLGALAGQTVSSEPCPPSSSAAPTGRSSRRSWSVA